MNTHPAPAPLRPRLEELLRSLRLDLTYDRARGDSLYHRDDAGNEIEVLDLVGGFGSLLLGHNHPVLVAEARALLDADRPVHAQGSRREHAQRLAAELSARIGGDHACIFGNSGAEAVEAAMKHAILRRGTGSFIALEGAFHGKTLGALQLTSNPFYRDAFNLPGIEVHRVAPGNIDALEAAFAHFGPSRPLAGFIFEPILGEGGVHALCPAFLKRAAELCRLRGASFIADECQTGLGRTGHLLASHALGLKPDCLLLSKILGGGLAKISACLIAREHYDDRFDLRHTSTFADDDHSSAIALKALELIDEPFLESVRDRGARLLGRLRELQQRHPEIIAEVRGKGLMLGIQFHPSGRSDGFLLRFLSSQNDLLKLLAGYLLHTHHVRVLPTLSDPLTLRLQPSGFITDAAIDQIALALEDLCTLLEDNDIVALSKFLIPDRDHTLPAPTIPREAPRFCAFNTPRFWHREQHSPRKRVAWLCHLVDADDLLALEPGLATTAFNDREALLERMTGSAAPVVMSSADLRSGRGDDIRLYTIMLPATSSHFAKCLARRDLRLPRALVQGGVDLARSLGCSMTALGQYTSIVTANGIRLNSGGMGLATGNSYAVVLAIEALHKSMRARGIDPRHATLAVLGAAGNIGRSAATLLAPAFGETILIGSANPGARRRLEKLAASLPAGKIRIATAPAAARRAHVVLAASNSPIPLLHSDHLREGAVVCDISVPAALAPEVSSARPDLHCIKGGIARLPGGEDLEIPGFPLPPGQTFACMAEGILLGLEGASHSHYTGTLRPERVFRIGAIARRHGFELAAAKTISVHEPERSSNEPRITTTATH